MKCYAKLIPDEKTNRIVAEREEMLAKLASILDRQDDNLEIINVIWYAGPMGHHIYQTDMLLI